MELQWRGSLDWWLIGSPTYKLKETNRLIKRVKLLYSPVGSVESHCALYVAVWLTISSIRELSAWRGAADSAIEAPVKSQDPEEAADSARESSALEQVQERVGDSFQVSCLHWSKSRRE